MQVNATLNNEKKKLENKSKEYLTKLASEAFKLRLEIEKSTTLTDKLNTAEHMRDAALK